MEIDMIIDNNEDYLKQIRKGIKEFNREKNETGYFAGERPVRVW